MGYTLKGVVVKQWLIRNGEGHPDKLCDKVSDGILDACLKVYPNAKVTMETTTKTYMSSQILKKTFKLFKNIQKSDIIQVVLLGEVRVHKTKVNFEAVARRVCGQIGFFSDDVGLYIANYDVIVNIQAQDPNITAAVHG